MNHRRAVGVLLAVVAATTLVTGSFGFTSVSADRGVSVAVVGSENAYVGVAVCEQGNGNGNGSDPVRVTVTNQFSSSFVVDRISWEDSAQSGDYDAVHPDETLAPGESAKFSNTFGGEEVTVRVSGGLDATVNAPVDGKCPGDGTGGENGTGPATPTDSPTPTSTPGAS